MQAAATAQTASNIVVRFSPSQKDDAKVPLKNNRKLFFDQPVRELIDNLLSKNRHMDHE